MRRALVAAVLAAVMVACSSSSSSEDDRCERVSSPMLDALATGLSTPLAVPIDAAAVRSGDFEQVWFLAATLSGGDVGVWATNIPPGTADSSGISGFFAIDDTAQVVSDWGDGDATAARMTMADDGAAEAEACL